MTAKKKETVLLLKLLDGTPTRVDVASIVNMTIESAGKYVYWLLWRRKLNIQQLGLSISDVAFDLVAGLVCPNEGEELGLLRTSMLSLREQQQDDFDPAVAFSAVVIRTAQVNIPRLFMEYNPASSRLLRGLRRFVKTSEEFVRVESLLGFSYARKGKDLRLELPPLSFDDFRRHLHLKNMNGNPAVSIMEACCELLDKSPEHRNVIPESDIIDLTVDLINREFMGHHISSSEIQETSDSRTMRRELQRAVEEVRSWVEDEYISRGKLSEADAEAMFLAIQRYVVDIHNDDAFGQFTYLRQAMPGLTQARYRESYRSTYQYILKKIFDRTVERLK